MLKWNTQSWSVIPNVNDSGSHFNFELWVFFNFVYNNYQIFSIVQYQVFTLGIYNDTMLTQILGVPLIFPVIGVAWGGTDYANPKTWDIDLSEWFFLFPVLILMKEWFQFHLLA